MKLFKVFIITICSVFYTVHSSSFSQKVNESVKQVPIDIIELKSTFTEEELLKFIKEDKGEFFQSKEDYINFIIEKFNPLESSNTITSAEIRFLIAENLTNQDQFYQAYEYLDEVSNILKSKDISKVPFAAEFYELKGTYYYNFRRYDEARESFWEALKQSTIEVKSKINVLNTLALTHRRVNNLDSSIYYFNSGLALAKQSNENEWVGIISGNLGYIYYLNDDLDNARKFLIIDKELSLKNNQLESALNAVAKLIELDLADGNYELVESNMNLIDSLIDKVSQLSSIAQYYHTKTVYWEHFKNYEKAYEAHRLSVLYKDSTAIKYDESNFQDMIFQIKFQKKKNENELLIEKQKRKGQYFYAVVIILSVIVIACVFIIYLMRKRKIIERRILELEKEKIQTELKHNEVELSKILKSLVEKNEIIDTLNQEFQKREEMEDNLALQKEKENLFEKINSFTLLTENDLIEFKQLFDKIHPGFYDALTQKYNDLTNAESRLAMLIKLNLSNLEMSRILGISQDSVRKTNFRLRKKLEISSQNELVQFILDI